MNNYELTLILKPSFSDKERDLLIEKIEKWVLESKGKIEKIDKMGKRVLSYQINKFLEGIYIFMVLNLAPKEVGQLDRKIKLDENIIRYLLVKKDKVVIKVEKKSKIKLKE